MESMNEEKELLEHVMKLMAEHFGKNCEIVLHDFMAPDNHTIIGIENGEVTGREIGGCVTNLGLEILNGKPAEDAFNYATYAENGHLLRSSSIYFHNSAGQPIGSLCINTDITDTTYFEKMLREAAQEAGVTLKQVSVTQQNHDHPILWTMEETSYLKFYIFQIVQA